MVPVGRLVVGRCCSWRVVDAFGFGGVRLREAVCVYSG